MHRIHLDHFAVAAPLISAHAFNIDDMAAMNADEQPAVESRFDVADGEGTKKLRGPGGELLELEYSSFAVDGRPDLSLVIYNPATAKDAERIRRLI